MVIITEGEPDWLTWATTRPDLAVLGVVAGAWVAELAARIPDGSKVVLRTHADAAGDAYAAKVAASFTGRKVQLARLKHEESNG